MVNFYEILLNFNRINQNVLCMHICKQICSANRILSLSRGEAKKKIEKEHVQRDKALASP